MGLADDMKKLTENISDARNSRLKMAKERVAQTRELLKDTRKLVCDFASDRKQSGAEQLKSLGEFVATLKTTVEDLRGDAENMRKNFRKEHKARTAALRAVMDNNEKTRAQYEMERRKNFQDMMGDIRSAISDVEKTVCGIKEDVAGKMSEFANSREKMNQGLRKELSSYADNISRDTSKLLSDARAMTAAFAKDRMEMAANWQTLSSGAVEKAPVYSEAMPDSETPSYNAVKPGTTRKTPKHGKKGKKKVARK